MKPETFFLSPSLVTHKQYEALRMYFVDHRPANEVASHFGYTYLHLLHWWLPFEKN